MSNQSDALKELAGNIDAESVLRDICGITEIIESGDELIHSCKMPFGMHKNGDQSPSASLNKETLLFNCFTCGGGSIFWLVENILDISSAQAIKQIREYSVGSVVDYDTFIDRLKNKLSSEKPVAIVDIPTYSSNIINQWTRLTSYMDSRGVSSKVQEEMQIGLREYGMEWVRDDRGLQQINVARIIIPHFFRGDLVGWQGRKLTTDPRIPKYKNSKMFPKAWTLYNYDNVDQNKELIVVESPMSVLKLKTFGIENVVSTFGASISHHQIRLIRDFSEVCIWMDGDDAGRKAAVYLSKSLSKTNNITLLDEDNEDPASVDDPIECLNSNRKSYLQWCLSLPG